MGGDSYQTGTGTIVTFFAVIFGGLFGVCLAVGVALALMAATVGWP